MPEITVPGYIYETADKDKTKLEELFSKFGNARRRAYSLKRKGLSKSLIERGLQRETGLNCRYVKDAYYSIRDLPPYVTFGGLRNQRMRERGKITKEEYRRRRNPIILSRGDRTKTGNLNLRLNLKKKSLRISTAREKEWINIGLFVPKKYAKKYGRFLDGSRPYTVTIKRRNDGKGYDVRISLRLSHNIREGNRVMALDINAGHIDFAVMEKSNKKLVATGKLNLHETQFARTGKRDYILHKAVDKIGNISRHYDADVAVGNLNTGKFKNKNRRANRKIKNIPQFKFRQMLKKLKRKGTKVMERSEAYTTVLGKELGPLIGLDTHKAAATSFCIKLTDYPKFVELLSGVRPDEGGGSQRARRERGSGLTVSCQGDLAGDDAYTTRNIALQCFHLYRGGCYPAIPGSWGLPAYADSLKTDFACHQVRIC